MLKLICMFNSSRVRRALLVNLTTGKLLADLADEIYPKGLLV